MRVKSKADAKIMLLGEYSVLKGGRALATTISKTLSVTLEKNPNNRHLIASNAWKQDFIGQNFDEGDSFVNDFCQWLSGRLNIPNVSLTIESDIAIEDGIGSSSALCLSILASLNHLIDAQLNLESIMSLARQFQLHHQGFASGYDIATQSHGGLICCRCLDDGFFIEQIPQSRLAKAISIFTGGEGAPTGIIGGSTRQWLYQTSGWERLEHLSESAIDALLLYAQGQSSSITFAIPSLLSHLEFFGDSPSFPHKVFHGIKQVPGFGQTWILKPTGAGGEDAMLAFHEGDLPEQVIDHMSQLGWHKREDLTFSSEGLRSFVSSSEKDSL
ncbi:MAG: hypothetical protein HRU19_19005 [Pseudobacteriovorax sp.]|nr:hypothetical protein [Pseudobacteriovorax sp.]